MQINEIFSSIDGEGIRTGYLTTFIRSQYCNLKCSYCDTKYTWDADDEHGNRQFVPMTVEDIVKKCEQLGNKRITFTGGEPLIQKDATELIATLIQKGFEVNVETNGAVNLLLLDLAKYKPLDESKLIITMDWKSPSSLMRDRMIESNLKLLRSNDVLKFVVQDQNDLDDMKKTIDSHDLHCNIFVSPIWEQIEGAEIVKYLQKYNMQNVRVQIQLHKYFWDPEKRGV